MRGMMLSVLLVLLGTTTQARECEVPGLGRGGNWVQIQELERAFRCVIAEIEELKRQQKQIAVLERQVAELRRRVPAEYININGKVTEEQGRLIGKATFVLDSSRSGKPFSLPLAQDVVEELCAEKSCHVLLSLSVSGVFSDEPLLKETIGPCGFNYDAGTGEWTLAAGCSVSGATGTDGDGGSAIAGGDADIILTAGEACLLTDTEIRTRPGQPTVGFGPDRSRGLYVASVPDRRPDIARPYQCVLEMFRTGPF